MNRYISFIYFVISFLVLFLTFGIATFNNDWIAYEELYAGIKPSPDLLYKFFFYIFNLLGIDYYVFYTINQSLIYILLLIFARKFSIKHLVVASIIVIILLGPNLSILLRYYTAFGFLLLGLYSYIVTKKRINSIFWLSLSLLSHFGIIVFFPFLFFYKYLSRIPILLKIIISCILLFFAGFINELFVKFNILTFALYIEEERSSLIGGLFAVFPYLFWILFILFVDKKIRRREANEITNVKYLFLYNLSMYSLLFLVPALFLQICIFRIIQPLGFVWIVYLLYSATYLIPKKSVPIFYFQFLMVGMSFAYMIYAMPIMFFGFSEWTYHLYTILASNRYGLFPFLTF